MNQDDSNENAGAFSGIDDFSGFFAPSWAKDEAAETVRVVGGMREPRHERPERGERGPRPQGQFRQDRGPRPERGPRTGGDRDGYPRGPRPERGERGERGDRGPQHGPRPERGPRQEYSRPEPPPALSVRFLPDGRALDAIIRRIQTTRRAYPFRDIVKLFRGDDASLAVRIEVDRDADPEGRVRQCRACSLPALTDDELVAHILDQHLGDFFETREVEVEPPSGNFPCVARCGLTGELLGPPNHHSYAARVQQMLRERFPGMSEQEYRSHIEMVKEPEAIEQWRESAKRQTLYFRKAEEKPEKQETPESSDNPAAAPGAAPEAAAEAPAPEPGSAADAPASAEPAPAQEPKGLTRQEAEAVFRRDILPTLAHSATHVVCQAKVLKNMSNRRLAHFLSGEFAHDEALRSQGSLARAVHAAFHHRGLHFFRAIDERGQEFVASVAPLVLDTTNVTAEIRSIVEFVAKNPCCQAKALIAAIAGDENGEAAKRLSASLRWLIEKGHVVEFFNGALVLAASHPFFSPKPPKPAKPAKEAAPEKPEKPESPEKPAEPEASAAPEPAPEAPAPEPEPGSAADAPASAESAPAPAEPPAAPAEPLAEPQPQA